MKTNNQQEQFWIGEFGKNYLLRNNVEDVVPNNIELFKKALKKTDEIKSILELGCNVGLNLKALLKINQNFKIDAYEIYEPAAKIAQSVTSGVVINESVTKKFINDKKYDLVFTKGVLIHINPLFLDIVYENMYLSSNKYILISEYYSPSPVTIDYRGEHDKLFKRDFAGELMDRYSLKLLDYGFTYHRDNDYPQDDENWFLLEKS